MWIDYLSSDDATYPDWFKYFATRSVLSMGKYDKQEHHFQKRDKATVTPFPDLNREAFAYVENELIKDIDIKAVIEDAQKEMKSAKRKHDKKRGKEFAQKAKGEIDEVTMEPFNESPYEQNFPEDNRPDELTEILNTKDFPQMYAYAIESVTPASKEALTSTDGEWRVYKQGEDHMPLVNSIQGHGTGWCTAGESTAKTQLSQGDFHVFYSMDEHGEPTVPRVAIRKEGDKIAEVRGVADQQNLDPYIGNVVQEKMAEFPDGEEYKEKSKDMQRLTEVVAKHENGEDLGKEDLAFIYQIDHKIKGFGYEEDKRIKELIENRKDKRQDIVTATGFKPEQISLTPEEAVSGDMKFHLGGLDLRNLTSAENLTFPESVGGELDLSGLTFSEGLNIPVGVRGKVVLPQFIKDELGW